MIDGANIMKGCGEHKELMETLGKFKKASDDWWKQPDAKKRAESNIKANAKEFEIQVWTLKKAWASGDYETAGAAYGKFWGIQMGEKF